MKSQISNLKSQKVVSEFSSGGVVYQEPGTRHQQPTLWLICKHSGYHKWVLPKGIVEDGESPEATAVREVREETGITARIIKKIEPDVRYTYRKGNLLVKKRVVFYLMEYETGDVADHSWEMEDAKWTSSETALRLLAFPDERKVLEKALETTR